MLAGIFTFYFTSLFLFIETSIMLVLCYGNKLNVEVLGNYNS